MEEAPESKRSSNAFLPILIVVAVVCVIGVILVGVIGLAAVFFLGVSLPSAMMPMPTPVPVPYSTMPIPIAPATPPSSTSSAANLLDQIAAGEALVNSVTVAHPGDTIGPLLSVWINNPSGQSIDTRLACGTIFQPGDSSEQRLMVIQETVVTIPPGQTANLTPYLACIDSDLGSPSGQGDYSVSAMADDKLLKLADCLCGQDIQAQAEADETRALAVQFAVWSVSDALDLRGLLDDTVPSQGALGDVFNGPLGSELKPFLTDIVAQSETLLTECGVGQ